MFPQRTNRRQNRSVSSFHNRRGGAARRLVIETMEDRLMLSATTFENASLATTTTRYSLSFGQFNVTSGQLVSVVAPSEGGYVSYTNTFSTGGVSQSADFGVTRGTVLTSDTTAPRPTYGSSFESDGLQPIVLTGGGSTFEPNIQPIIAGPPGSTPGQNEGGAIPIHSLITDLRRDASLASAAKSTVSITHSVRVQASSTTTISGEWARAMVFEIAGGEPGESGKPMVKNAGTLQTSEPNMQLDDSLSSLDSLRRQNNLIAGNDSALPPNAPSQNIETEQPQTGQSAAPGDALIDRTAASNLMYGLNGYGEIADKLLLPANRDDAASTEGDTTDSASLGSDAAFEQMGDDAHVANIESSTKSDTWVRSISAAPLLMILALERIAAVNSRRATREAAAKAWPKPLHSHDWTGADRK
jgi:hypothetical protein